MAQRAGPKLKPQVLDLSGLPEDTAERRIAFMAQFCGVELYDWQAEVIRDLGGFPRPRVAYVQVGRKNGKTLLAAAMALTELCLFEERHIYAISDTERNLNSVLIREIRQMVARSPQLSASVHVFKWGLEYEPGRSFIEVRPGKFQASQGINPHLILFDEVHLQRSDEIWSGMQMAGAAREDALLFGITTPGYDLGSLAHSLYQQVKNGDPLMYGRIFEPHGEPDIDDEQAWRDANPCFERPAFIEGMKFDRLTLPEHEFRRFRLGQWTTTASGWLPYGVWDSRAVAQTPPWGTKITVGFDGSFSGDSTALVGCTLDGHVFVLGCWENPGQRGWRVPRDEVEAAVSRAFKNYDVVELVCDPPYWQHEIAEWQKSYKAVTEFYTNRRERMAPACTEFYAAVMESRLTNDGDKRLSRHVANCVVRPTPEGDVVTKQDKNSPAKIDLAVAAIIAFHRAMWHASNSKPKAGVLNLAAIGG